MCLHMVSPIVTIKAACLKFLRGFLSWISGEGATADSKTRMSTSGGSVPIGINAFWYLCMLDKERATAAATSWT